MASADDNKRSSEEIAKQKAAYRELARSIEVTSTTMEKYAAKFLTKNGEIKKSVEQMFAAFDKGEDMVGKKGRVTKTYATIKNQLREMAAFAPAVLQKMGRSQEDVFARTITQAERVTPAFIATHQARHAAVAKILKQSGVSEADASKSATAVSLKGHADQILSINEVARQKMAEAGKDKGARKMVFDWHKGELQKVRQVEKADTDKRTKEQISLNQLQSKLINQSATQAIQSDRGAFGSFARSAAGKAVGLQSLAKAEQDAVKKVAAGETMGAASGGMLQFLSGAAGGISSLVSELMPLSQTMGVVGGVFGLLVKSLDGVKRAGGESASAFAAQGNALTSMGDAAATVATLGGEVTSKTRDLGIASAVAGVSLNELNADSARLAQTIGGLGGEGPLTDFIAGLTHVRFLAPLAGVSGERALQIVAQAAKGLDVAKNDPAKYFNTLRTGAAMAGMTVEDLASSIGDMNQLGAQFGGTADQMIKDVGMLTQGFGMSAAQSGLMTRSFSGLVNRSLGSQIGFDIAARGGDLSKAFTRMNKANAGSGGTGLLALEAMDLKKIMNEKIRGTGPEADAKKALFLQSVNPELGKAFFFNENIRKMMGSQETLDPKAFQSAMDEATKNDPAKASALIMASQKTVIENILGSLNALSEFLFNTLSSGTFDVMSGGGGKMRAMQAMAHTRSSAMGRVTGNEAASGPNTVK